MGGFSTEPRVHGVDVDAETRCAHWNSALDVIAIKFQCCRAWYACYKCHQALAGHDAETWPATEFDKQAVFCGMCKSQLAINEYLGAASKCPRCGAGFNPGCAKHYDLYFEV